LPKQLDSVKTYSNSEIQWFDKFYKLKTFGKAIDVLENSKAEEIGLEQGDVIVGVHVRGAWKKKVYTFEDLKQLLSRANGQLRLYVRDCNTGNYVWTSSTRFRGRLAGNVVRSSAGDEAEPAEEEGFSEDEFQPGDAGDVEESAEDGSGGESL
jgi:hypothetical protein